MGDENKNKFISSGAELSSGVELRHYLILNLRKVRVSFLIERRNLKN